jgi:DNA helicase-4
MVDEFQDASQARARLVRGLVSEPGRFLLAVGDDWHSINRFAGADLSLMTRFEQWFARGPQLTLTSTFRCTQTICDVARAFVSKNPSQFNKPMCSVNEESAGSVTVMRSNDDGDAVASYLDRLSAGVGDGSVIAGPSGTVSSAVLGRYGFQREVVPRNFPPRLDVTFRTTHGSKGLEADYVVIPGMTTGTYGIPSNITDDPVLYLAMPTPESFAHAEERRLLYVALTRARREVVLIAPPDRMSPFVVELLEYPYVKFAESRLLRLTLFANGEFGVRHPSIHPSHSPDRVELTRQHATNASVNIYKCRGMRPMPTLPLPFTVLSAFLTVVSFVLGMRRRKNRKSETNS